MSGNSGGNRRILAVFAVILVSGLIAGAIGVYVMRSGAGNSSGLAAVDCAGAVEAAHRASPLARGEIAAFRPATEPESFADLAFKAPDGADITLAAFAGKTTLVNLWATWCVPCRAEMPALDRLKVSFGGKDFQVVAINVDLRNEARARAFLAEIGANDLAFYSDPTTGVFSTLKGRGLALGLPTTILVDGKGCRIGVVEGPAAWDSEEAKALIEAAMPHG